jgi:hypothetical protein
VAQATALANFTWKRCGIKTLAAYREALARRHGSASASTSWAPLHDR